MDKIVYLCLIITYLIKPSNTLCTLRDDGLCFFTIICDDPSIITKTPYCEHPDLFITLTINNSTTNNITENFFASKFDSWVRMFNAIGYNWTYVQNSAFNNFKKVLYMDISNNNIKSIGSAFKDLKDLDFLNMSRNILEEINPETFYISDNTNRLHLLDLSYNRLTHLSENIFIHLNNLKKLHLQGNRITTIQKEYSKYLKSLDYLNLCCNNIRTLKLKYMKMLKELNLSFNGMKHFNISGLISLETIDLSHNNIKHFRFDYIDEIPYLGKLDLSHNQITKLTRVSERKVNKYSDDIKTRLIKLDLDNNNISYIDNDFFITFEYISYLNLSFNEITEFDPGTFKNVKVLKHLNISGNNLKLNDETFNDLNKTEVIDISNNNISLLEAIFFKDCSVLKRIVADRNQIRYVDMYKFMEIVPKLTRITLLNNPNSDLGRGVLYKCLQLFIDIVNTILLFILLFGILFILIYIGIYRRGIFVYVLKCLRYLIDRNHVK